MRIHNFYMYIIIYYVSRYLLSSSISLLYTLLINMFVSLAILCSHTKMNYSVVGTTPFFLSFFLFFFLRVSFFCFLFLFIFLRYWTVENKLWPLETQFTRKNSTACGPFVTLIPFITTRNTVVQYTLVLLDETIFFPLNRYRFFKLN